MEHLGEIEKRQGRSHKETKGNVFKKVSIDRTKNNLEGSKQDGANYQGQEIRDDASIFFLGLEDVGRWVLGDIDVHFFLNPRLDFTWLLYEERESKSKPHPFTKPAHP